MSIEARVPLFDLISRISETVDLVEPTMANHHIQVGYIAYSIAVELDFPKKVQQELLMAGALHDIGAFSVAERMQEFHFDTEPPHRHARAGYSLLKDFKPFANIAKLILYHHLPWAEGEGAAIEGVKVPLESHVLNLADHIAVLINPQEAIIWQAQRIRDKIAEYTPTLFVPEVVDAFQHLSLKDYFWFDVASRSTSSVLRKRVELPTLELEMDSLLSLANLFRRMIDFRSRFTATHSSGVAVAATALARLSGFSEHDCLLMQIASYFHDVGKLAISQEIFEKTGRLNEYEYDLMRSHVYHTYRILEPILDIDVVRTWGALHQEYLDGTGYPFRYTGQELPLGSRILVVADVFTALVEDRPYRLGMTPLEGMEVLHKLAHDSKIDPDVVHLLDDNFDHVNTLCADVQEAAQLEYRQFTESIAD